MNKNRSAVMAVCLALVASAGAQRASGADTQRVSLLYKQGLSALDEGNADLARQSFLEVLRAQPRHINARIQLDRLKDRSGEMASLKRKHQLKRIVVPKVDYDEVTLTEALEALSMVISQETDGKFAANFIVLDPQGALDNRPVSLRLQSVPASVVLKHLLTLADARERYDEHAIVVRPLNVGPATPVVPSGGLE